MQIIIARHQTGSVLIEGSFGHEWEYESPFPVYRFVPSLLSQSQAVVCLHVCEQPLPNGWKKISGNVTPEIWMH